MIHAIKPLSNTTEQATHFPDQLVTVGDLHNFRVQLLKEIKKLLSQAVSTPSISTKPWLKSGEVRKLLNISTGTLQTLRSNGTLRYNKVGGIIYYQYEDIQSMMNKSA
jgi:hypothetical protein